MSNSNNLRDLSVMFGRNQSYLHCVKARDRELFDFMMGFHNDKYNSLVLFYEFLDDIHNKLEEAYFTIMYSDKMKMLELSRRLHKKNIYIHSNSFATVIGRMIFRAEKHTGISTVKINRLQMLLKEMQQFIMEHE